MHARRERFQNTAAVSITAKPIGRREAMPGLADRRGLPSAPSILVMEPTALHLTRPRLSLDKRALPLISSSKSATSLALSLRTTFDAAALIASPSSTSNPAALASPATAKASPQIAVSVSAPRRAIEAARAAASMLAGSAELMVQLEVLCAELRACEGESQARATEEARARAAVEVACSNARREAAATHLEAQRLTAEVAVLGRRVSEAAEATARAEANARRSETAEREAKARLESAVGSAVSQCKERLRSEFEAQLQHAALSEQDTREAAERIVLAESGVLPQLRKVTSSQLRALKEAADAKRALQEAYAASDLAMGEMSRGHIRTLAEVAEAHEKSMGEVEAAHKAAFAEHRASAALAQARALAEAASQHGAECRALASLISSELDVCEGEFLTRMASERASAEQSCARARCEAAAALEESHRLSMELEAVSRAVAAAEVAEARAQEADTTARQLVQAAEARAAAAEAVATAAEARAQGRMQTELDKTRSAMQRQLDDAQRTLQAAAERAADELDRGMAAAERVAEKAREEQAVTDQGRREALKRVAELEAALAATVPRKRR